MNHLIQAGDRIEIVISTKGDDAKAKLEEVVDLSTSIGFIVNDMEIICPRYATVNGKLETGSYELNDGDNIDLLNYYTLTQLMQFMDIETPHEVFVNGARANADTKIYENFNVAWIDHEEIYRAERFVEEEETEEEETEEEDIEEEKTEEEKAEEAKAEEEKTEEKIEERDTEENDGKNDEESSEATEKKEDNTDGSNGDEEIRMQGVAGFGIDVAVDANESPEEDKKSEKRSTPKKQRKTKKKSDADTDKNYKQEELSFDDKAVAAEEVVVNKDPHDIHVLVNGKPLTLTGKAEYVFIDIFDKYDFDLKNVGGTRLVQTLDGQNTSYFSSIYEGSVIEIYWEK